MCYVCDNEDSRAFAASVFLTTHTAQNTNSTLAIPVLPEPGTPADLSSHPSSQLSSHHGLPRLVNVER